MKTIICKDKFNQVLSVGDFVDVQRAGPHEIYIKDDGQLYFKPYDKEELVSSYFSNDMVKCDIDGNWITNDRYEDEDSHIKSLLEIETLAFEKRKELGLKGTIDGFIAGYQTAQEQLYNEETLIEVTNWYLDTFLDDALGLNGEAAEEQVKHLKGKGLTKEVLNYWKEHYKHK